MLSNLIDERGTLTYLSRSYTASGTAERTSEVAGMVVMRNEADLRSIGGPYYDDGFGNLMRFGEFVSPPLGGVARYALTFRKSGGLQLALDLRNDDIVDMVVELGLDGRLGALADPDFQWLLDCLSQQLVAGDDLVTATNTCLASVGGGGGGGLGVDAASDLSRLAEPDCDRSGQLPIAGQTSNPATNTTVIDLDNGDRIKATTTENADGTTDVIIDIHDSKGRLVYHEETTLNKYGEISSQIEATVYTGDGNTNTVSIRRWERGVPVEPHRPSRSEIEGARRVNNPTRRPSPGPDCTDCPVYDPRCAPAPNDIASLWDCQAETDMSLDECLRHMQDVIYTATGGRCSTEPGSDDRPTIRCSERGLQQCLESGRSVAECILAFPGHDRSVDDPGPGDDDFMRNRFGQSRGRVGFYIDTTPMAAVFVALCGGGVEQFCRGGGRF
jgi:hypothetical protein